VVESELMSYRALINRSLKKTFVSLKDLQFETVFTKHTEKSFDFSTSSSSETVVQEYAKIIVLKTIQETPNTLRKRLLVDASGMKDIRSFDRVLISGEEWKLGSILDVADFVYLMDAYKEL
jgi:hypothetical protein